MKPFLGLIIKRILTLLKFAKWKIVTILNVDTFSFNFLYTIIIGYLNSKMEIKFSFFKIKDNIFYSNYLLDNPKNPL